MGSNGKWKKPGDTVYNYKLGDTLELLATEGPDVLYNGSLAKDYIDDLKEKGTYDTANEISNVSSTRVSIV